MGLHLELLAAGQSDDVDLATTGVVPAGLIGTLGIEAVVDILGILGVSYIPGIVGETNSVPEPYSSFPEPGLQ
jgi:hypothetical protein